MKSEDVKLGKKLNDAIWQRGITNPPHKVKVTATKNDKGEVYAELFGVAKEEVKREKKVKKAKPVKEAAIPKKNPVEQK